MQDAPNDPARRQLLSTIAATVIAGHLGTAGSAHAQGATGAFAPLKKVDAGLLRVGYAEAGRPDAPAVLLLHGWPYDIHTYAEVTPLLAAAGYRVIVPYLRGYGTTRFLSDETVRNGQQSALAVDMIAVLDALGIRQAVIGGCDWGART
ncbi:alpha/beta fold hydrolase, partial [Paracraurococcus lichenis]